MESRVFRSVIAPVAGRLAFEQVQGRIQRLQDVTIHSARLLRTGARKRRKLVAPTYDARFVVELPQEAAEVTGMRRPYRGVSSSDFQSLIGELGARAADVESGSVTFLARAFRRSVLEDLATDLRTRAAMLSLQITLGVHERDSPMLEGWELPGRATGAAAAIADFAEYLRATGIAGGWNLRVRWFDRAAHRGGS